MRRLRPFVAAGAGVVVLAASVALQAADPGAETGGAGATRAAPTASASARATEPRVVGLGADARGADTRRAARDSEARKGRLSAYLLRPAVLRFAPGGRRVARVGRRTGYGSRRVFAVGRLRPGWVGVRALQRPNGRLAWLPEDAVRLRPVRTTLVADLSARELTVRVDGRLRHRAPVGIGRPGSETPLGRFGVTDRLRAGGDEARAVYGCCAIALTGNQPNPPPGWTGGTRLALHGTPSEGSVGREVSAGCLRMRGADLRRLLRTVPLGATLTVRR